MSRTSATRWVRIVAAVRKQGRTAAAPCALCHGARGPIDYRTQGEADRDAREVGEWWLLGAYRPLALAVDHVIPYAAGGTDTMDNTQPTHGVCNAEAGAKTTARKPRREHPQNGFWRPLNGQGQPLPGRALHGAHTATHEFVAGPHAAAEGGLRPRRDLSRADTFDIPDTPVGSETPRRQKWHL